MAATELVARGHTAWSSAGAVSRVAMIVLAAGGVVSTALWLPVTWRAIAVAAGLASLWLAAVIDLAERRLPNLLVLSGFAAAVVGTMIVALAEGLDDGRRVTVSVLAGAVAMAVPMLLMHLISPVGMGFGDVKIGIALGATVGLVDAWSAVLALMVGSLLAALAGLVGRRRSVPFGPALVAGAVIALLAARAVGVRPV